MIIFKLENDLSKRDYFAAVALQGLCGNQNLSYKLSSFLAETAVECADALIKELDKNG